MPASERPSYARTYARGVRRAYRDLPEAVRAFVEDQLDGPVTEVHDAVGGFAPGVAATVCSAAGGVFCKVASSVPNPTSLALYRQERDRLAALPDSPMIAKPLASTDLDLTDETFSITVLPALPGRVPAHPWTEPEADLVFTRLAALSQTLRLHPGLDGLPGSDHLVGFFESDTPLADDLRGDVPCHCDLRADNVLVHQASDRVWFVDWAEVCLAAPWVDPAILACDLVVSRADLADGGSMDVWRFLRTHPATAWIAPELLQGMMVALGRALWRLAGTPAPPGLPTIRAWQRACGDTLLAFAKRKTEHTPTI